MIGNLDRPTETQAVAADTEDTRPLNLIELSRAQEAMCQALDTLHRWGGLAPETGGRQQRMPTDMFGGALFASRTECERNPDWIAQAAQSLREIMHPFHARTSPKDRDRAKALGVVPAEKRELYQALLEDLSIDKEADRLWRHLNSFSHHHRREEREDLPHTRDGFTEVRRLFETVMGQIRPGQPESHGNLGEIALDDPDRLPAENGEPP